MSVKSKFIVSAAAGIAALGLTAGAMFASVTQANAATPSCGNSCANVFSREFGTHHHPGFVLDALQRGQKAGTKVILYRTSNTDPAEDFSAEFNSTTADFYAAGLVSSQVALHYGCTTPTFATCAAGVNDPAFEIEYAPYGVASCLCVGLATTAVSGEGVTLQDCGVSSKTVWIADTADSPATITHAYVPLISGSDTNFSHPFVLTYPADGYPTDIPRPQLQVANITGFTQGTPPGPVLGTVNDTQLWGADFGVLR